jgi:exosortase
MPMMQTQIDPRARTKHVSWEPNEARPSRSLPTLPIGLGLGTAAVVIWAYWSTLCEMAQKWQRDAQYSHGYLVPVFALVLLWLRWPKTASQTFRSNWWGMALLLPAVALRLVSGYYGFDWPDGFSLLPALAGICVLLVGWRGLAWAWPAIGFLIFMIPLPFRLEVGMGQPLQRIATVASTYLLQCLGQPALAEGNTIILNEVTLGVVEACSGLRMLVVFFALSSAVALVIKRPWWERGLIVLSAIPIAIFTNVVRITVTGLLHEYAGSEVADRFFHDPAGWLMMPFALALLWIELKVLAHLFIDESDTEGPVGITWLQNT